MINLSIVTGHLSTSLEWSRDSMGNRMCAFKIFHRKRKDSDPSGLLYNIPVRIYKKIVLDRLTENFDRGDYLFIHGKNAAYNDDELVRQGFIEAYAVYNLTRAAERIAGDAKVERQKQLAQLVEDSLTRACHDSEFGINIW
jgi:hypothetical protein